MNFIKNFLEGELWVTNRKTVHWAAGFILLTAFLSVIWYAATRHTLFRFGFWTMLVCLAVFFLSWLEAQASKPKQKKEPSRSVPMRTKVAPGGTVFETKRGVNASKPAEPGNHWFTASEPSLALAGGGTTAQAGAAAKPNVLAAAMSGIGDWFNKFEKETIMMILSGIAAFALWLIAYWQGSQAFNDDASASHVLGMFIAMFAAVPFTAGAFGQFKAFFLWAGKYPAFVLLLLFAAAAVCFGVHAHWNAYLWSLTNWEWDHVGFVAMTIAAILSFLALCGLLGDVLKGVGGFLVNLHSGKWSFALSMVVVLAEITFASLFLMWTTKSPIFDRILNAREGGEAAALDTLTLVVFAAICLVFGAVGVAIMKWRKNHTW